MANSHELSPAPDCSQPQLISGDQRTYVRIPKENFDWLLAATKVPGVETLPVEILERIASERRILKSFFGKDIPVVEPPVPLFDTAKKLEELGIEGFEPIYSQGVVLTQDADIPGWKVKPSDTFWELLKYNNVSSESAHLYQGWYLVDTRVKPNFEDNQKFQKDRREKYEDDYLAPIIEDLRKKGTLSEPWYYYIPSGGRHGISPQKAQRWVLKEFGDAIETKGVVRIKRYAEHNIWGNTHFPKWGDTSSEEYFADNTFWKSGHLVGGDVKRGGLAHVGHNEGKDHNYRIGWGVVIDFSSLTRKIA